ncbi:Ig-like domain-containing protein [Methanobrevibacter ruminantium]|uniref:Ig-like domain-containing protein n=1 Tax=Methanobrevibacter ruminantium TaxID=83816 RepID=UPI000A7668E5|nr:Ig-like domain repeat protein [Methanobrevibacter ruminantium]
MVSLSSVSAASDLIQDYEDLTIQNSYDDLIIQDSFNEDLIQDSSNTELKTQDSSIDNLKETINQTESIDDTLTNQDLSSLQDSSKENIKDSNLKSSRLGKSITVKGNTFQSIQSAIDGAEAGDTIILSENMFKGDNYYGLGEQIYINKSLTIMGSSQFGSQYIILNALHSSRIFNITADNVTISNIQFTNGYVVGEPGGAIYWFGNNGKIINSYFSLNCANSSMEWDIEGGAIYFGLKFKNQYIENCLFKYNSAYDGGALYTCSQNTTISKCTFDSNFGISNNAGGMANGAALSFSAKDVYVIDSTFLNNDAPEGWGGAVYIYKHGYEPYFFNCSFKNNSAAFGGAICWLTDGGTFLNCTFENNHATGGDAIPHGGAIYKIGRNGGNIINSTFTRNYATTGSAIYLNAYLNIDNCTFTDNQADSEGAIYIITDNVTIRNCLFDKNYAYNYGAAIFSWDHDNIKVENSRFIENHARNEGGAIYFLGKNCQIYGCLFEGNRVSNFYSFGGAVFMEISGEDTSILDCSFKNNSALYKGGALYISYGSSEKIAIINSSFEDNSASNGGAIQADWNLSLIANSSFEDNSASYGGAIQVFGSVDLIANSSFEDNSASYGGAIHVFRSIGLIANSTFKNNYANSLEINQSKESYGRVFTFKGKENYINAIYTEDYSLNFENVTYWDGSFVTSGSPIKSDCEAGIKIRIVLRQGVSAGPVVLNITKITNIKGEVVFNEYNGLSPGIYYYEAYHPKDSYYSESEKLSGMITVPKKATDNTLAISLDDSIYGEDLKVNVNTDVSGEYRIYIANSNYDAIFTDDDVAKGNVLAYDITVNENELKGNKWTILKNSLNVKNGYGAYIQFADLEDGENYINIHNRTSFNVYKAESSIDANETIAIEGDGAEVNYTIENGTASIDNIRRGSAILEEGTDYNFTVTPDKIIITGLDMGNYTVKLKTIVDSNYNPSTKEVFICILGRTAIDVQESVAIEKDKSYLLSPTLIPEDAGTLRYISNDESIVKVDSKGNLTAISEGNTTIMVLFDGNDIYAPSNATVKVSVYSGSMPTSIKVNKSFELYMDESIDMGAVLDPANAGNLTYKSSNEKIVKVDNYGKITGLGQGKANITVSFSGNEKFLASNATALVTVYPLVDLKIAKSANVSGEVYIGDKIKFVITVSNNGPSNATGVYVNEALNSNLVLASNSTTKGNYDGSKWTIGNLNKGETVNLTIIANVKSVGNIDNKVIANSTERDSNYTNNIASISTIKALPIVDLSINVTSNKKSLNVGDTFTYTINLINLGPSKATNIIVDELLSQFIELVNVNLSIGNYDNSTSVWSVDQLDPNSPVSLNLTVKAIRAGKIENSVTAYSNEKDSNESNNNFTLSINCVKINTQLTANNITTSYNLNKDLIIGLNDSKGNPLSGFIVSVDLNGKKNYTTDSNGQIKIPTKSLIPDTYNATIRFEGNEKYYSSHASAIIVVKRASTSLNYTNMNTVAFDSNIEGRVGEYFQFQLLDNDGKPIAGKQVFIGFNGVKYNRTTNQTGEARLQINLKYANHYTFAIAFLGDNNYSGDFQVALINVTEQTPVLTTSPKTYKSTAKTKALTATLKSSRGQALAGKKITFTLNGKVYSGNTNSDGIATVNVSLSKKGTYSFTAQYGGDSTYKKVTKSSKLTIK